LNEVKAHVSELVSRASREHERITVAVHGRPTAVLMAVEHLESLRESLDILADPEAMADPRQAEQEIARGEIVTGEDVVRDLAEWPRAAS